MGKPGVSGGIQMKSNSNRSAASSFGLRSSLRQSGGRFGAAFWARLKACPSASKPFRFEVAYELRGAFKESGSRLRAMTHLIDDETVAKMGHPDLDVGHPADGGT